MTGILRADGSVDLQRMKEIVEYAKPLKYVFSPAVAAEGTYARRRVTFHRAIDVCSDPVEALKVMRP